MTAARPGTELRLRQRGRADLAFLAETARRLGRARGALRRDAVDAGLGDRLPARLADREALLMDRLARRPSLETSRLLAEWMSGVHGASAKAAFAEVVDELGGALDLDDGGPVPDPALAVPDYYAGVDFHRTEGGWDGHPEMGFVHSEMIFERIINASRGIDIFAQRRAAAAAAPRRDYRRIYEPGVSNGWFTLALAQTFPDAEIAGCDLSYGMLREAYRVGRRAGHRWRLRHADAAATGEPAGSVDLVASYILFHELPAAAARAVIAEAFRLLEPGGDVLVADFAPIGRNDPLDELLLHFGARAEGGEPWLHEYLELDLEAELAAAGFTGIEARGVGPKAHPYVTTARKPA